MKRAFDVIVSAMLLVVLAPLLLLIAMLIRVTMGSPVLFRQPRTGLRGALFDIRKFRTMRADIDQTGRRLPDELRLTGFGQWLRRTSLDELPSLINVLRGEMSLVGPRPLLPEYLPLYSERQARRHEVKPGLTGWAQVNGRNSLSWEQKFELDVWYVENRTLLLDIRILALTILKVLAREGINQRGHATAEKFCGAAPSQDRIH